MSFLSLITGLAKNRTTFESVWLGLCIWWCRKALNISKCSALYQK